MKKLSVLFLSIFSVFFFCSASLMAQEETTVDKETTEETKEKVKEEVKEEATKEVTEHESAIKEDSTVDHVEKVYEKEEVSKLKGKPKTYTDGYNTYVNNKVKFELFDTDNIKDDSIFYKVDEGQDQKYTEPFNIDEEGKHVIYYYSVDKMGNKEEVKALNVIVDKTAPEVTVVVTAPFSKTGDVIYASDKFNYKYSISAKDNISGVSSIEYSTEDTEAKEYVKPFEINAQKPVKIKVAAEDRVGNLTQKYITKVLDEDGNVLTENLDDMKIVVDKTAPTVEIKADKEFFKKDETTNVASKEYKYTITAADTESGVKALYYRIDSKSEFILYTGEITFKTNGYHKIEAIARDKVGNTSKTAVLDVYVDTIPADTQIKMVAE